jgi:hypothetical protein
MDWSVAWTISKPVFHALRLPFRSLLLFNKLLGDREEFKTTIKLLEFPRTCLYNSLFVRVKGKKYHATGFLLYGWSCDVCLHDLSLSGSIQYWVGCSIWEVSETACKTGRNKRCREARLCVYTSVINLEGTEIRETVVVRRFHHQGAQFTLFSKGVRAQNATLVAHFVTVLLNLERKAENCLFDGWNWTNEP